MDNKLDKHLTKRIDAGEEKEMHMTETRKPRYHVSPATSSSRRWSSVCSFFIFDFFYYFRILIDNMDPSILFRTYRFQRTSETDRPAGPVNKSTSCLGRAAIVAIVVALLLGNCSLFSFRSFLFFCQKRPRDTSRILVAMQRGTCVSAFRFSSDERVGYPLSSSYFSFT